MSKRKNLKENSEKIFILLDEIIQEKNKTTYC
jgi:hypothetical protein